MQVVTCPRGGHICRDGPNAHNVTIIFTMKIKKLKTLRIRQMDLIEKVKLNFVFFRGDQTTYFPYFSGQTLHFLFLLLFVVFWVGFFFFLGQSNFLLINRKNSLLHFTEKTTGLCTRAELGKLHTKMPIMQIYLMNIFRQEGSRVYFL